MRDTYTFLTHRTRGSTGQQVERSVGRHDFVWCLVTNVLRAPSNSRIARGLARETCTAASRTACDRFPCVARSSSGVVEVVMGVISGIVSHVVRVRKNATVALIDARRCRAARVHMAAGCGHPHLLLPARTRAASTLPSAALPPAAAPLPCAPLLLAANGAGACRNAWLPRVPLLLAGHV